MCMYRTTLIVALALFWGGELRSRICMGADSVGGGFVILPSQIELNSPEARQTVVVQGKMGEEFEGQLAKGVH